MQGDSWVLAADESVAVEFDRDRVLRPTEVREQVDDGRVAREDDRFAVGSDGDAQGGVAQDFGVAANFAAAFFCVL